MNPIDKAVKETIKKNHLKDWLKKYPWLVGYLGNRKCPVWFVAENPSLRGVIRINALSRKPSTNLQWNVHAGDWLFREALVTAGLKRGKPRNAGGWKCYITDVIKEPEFVEERNAKKRDHDYWKTQALHWLPVFVREMRLGKPRVLVAVGYPAFKVLEFWSKQGVPLPTIERIPHYSYVIFRPDNKRELGPGHRRRRKEFISAIVRINKHHAAKTLGKASQKEIHNG